MALEIVSKDNGCFEGRLKMGPLMDSSELSEQKFTVGNSNSGCAYIKTFHSLYLDVCLLLLISPFRTCVLLFLSPPPHTHTRLILKEWKGHVETEDSISKVNGRQISYVNQNFAHQGDGIVFFLISPPSCLFVSPLLLMKKRFRGLQY